MCAFERSEKGMEFIMAMKKILRYVVMLIVIYLVVQIFVYFLTKAYYIDLQNYEILVKEPKIEITDSKVSKNKGYISGKTTNNTGTLIKELKIKFDFYNENGNFLGSEYKEIDYFNVNEEVDFDVKYYYQNVNEFKVSIISK